MAVDDEDDVRVEELVLVVVAAVVELEEVVTGVEIAVEVLVVAFAGGTNSSTTWCVLK